MPCMVAPPCLSILLPPAELAFENYLGALSSTQCRMLLVKPSTTLFLFTKMTTWGTLSFSEFKTGIVRAAVQELLEHTVGHENFGMFTTPRLIDACEETQVPKREKGRERAFVYNAEPKVRRARKILGQPRPGQVEGVDRVPTDRTGLRFLLGVDDVSDLIQEKRK